MTVPKNIEDRMFAVQHQIVNDLTNMGVPSGYSLVVRSYSKSYYGRYFPNKKRIFVYLYRDSKLTKERDYNSLFRTVLHEVTHFLQYSDPYFVRKRGVMHNPDFYRIYNDLVRDAINETIIC